VLEFIGVKYYAWFLLGIYAYKYTENANRQHLVYATLLTIMGSAHLMLKYEVTLFLIINLMLIYLIFILPVCFGKLQRFLSVKPLVFIGSISYPFYLLHQNIVTGAAITAFKSGLDVPVIFYPIPFIILVGIVSYGIARTEPNIRALFKRQRVSTVIS
jgi:peptidoglycan/LPS O-acetylase OafA/YrhL